MLGMRLGGMEENKKSGGRDVRAKALSWDIEWKKAKNVFFGFFPLSPTVARCARHSHPSPPEEKAASRKKSRLRRKKMRLTNSGWGQIKFCNSVTKVTAIVVALFVYWCEITLPP